MAKSKTQETVETVVIEENDELSFLFVGDVGPDDSELWAERYKRIQWNNKEKSWEFPLAHWAGTYIEQAFDVQDIKHNKGQSVESGMLVPEISLSVLSYRTTWETYIDDKLTYTAKPDFDDGNKWSKRYNFLVLVKVDDWVCDEPVLVTVKGHTGAYLENGLNSYRKKMIQMGLQLGGQKMPGYVYWCAMAAGDEQLVGKKEKSEIYPPTPIIDSMTDLDNASIGALLSSAYIGQELHQRIKSALFDEAEQWRTEHIDNDTMLLDAGPVEPVAEMLPGGLVILPDLSKAGKSDWIKCAMSTGLFSHERHAGNALAKVLNKTGYGANKADQWEAFRTDIERRYREANPATDDGDDFSEIAERQRMLQA